jgi:hypothetical protein
VKRLVTLVLLVAVSAACGASFADDTPEGYPSVAEIVKGGGCAPKDNTARILASANPLDLVPNWSKNNYVGTSWSFLPKRYVVTELQGGVFLQGDLISPRGGTTDENVFILFAEWDCAS